MEWTNRWLTQPSRLVYQKDLRDWIHDMDIQRPYAANIHLRTGNLEIAPLHFKYFVNRFERAIGLRDRPITIIPMLETKGHLHYHFIASCPANKTDNQFKEAFKKSCKKTKQLYSYGNLTQKCTNHNFWIEYMTKLEKPQDGVDIANLHNNDKRNFLNLKR